MTLSNRTRAIDPVKYRAIQQVTSADGFFQICALDHLREFAVLLDADVDFVAFEEIVAAKAALVRDLGEDASAVLMDAEYSFQALALGALPRNTGIIAAIEDETYTFPNGPRATRLREGWDAKKIKLAGAGMAKLLWFYRPDLDQEVAQSQRALLADVQAACDAVSLPLVVEPIWFATAEEDATSPEWKQRRIEGILRSAQEADAVGVDLLKVEFPGYVTTDAEIAAAREACAALDASVSVPWVILSAGVNFEQFATQVEIACAAGASGYMAGRSVWSDAVTRDAEARTAGVAAARLRLQKLAAIARAHGRPFRPVGSLDDTIAAAPSGWYRTWAS